MKPGEVYQIYSTIAGKQKYHLCVALSGGFLFLNCYGLACDKSA